MGTQYSQLTPNERKRIEELLSIGKNLSEVAYAIGRHKSTISREVRRNAWEEVFYFSRTAQIVATERRYEASARLKIDPDVWALVEAKLSAKWSPEQISERLKMEGKGKVSTSTIYSWIWLDRKGGGGLFRNLRIANRKRKKRNLPLRQHGPIQNEKKIEERPAIVDRRQRLGDLEGDTIHFSQDRKAGLLTITDRVSKRIRIKKLRRRKADITANQFIEAIRPLEGKVQTITLDRGAEFSNFADIEKKTGAEIYFADPYTASQRGSIENQNGLIRQFFPRQTQMTELNGPRIKQVETLMNNRPRKALGYLTPLEYENNKTLSSLFS